MEIIKHDISLRCYTCDSKHFPDMLIFSNDYTREDFDNGLYVPVNNICFISFTSDYWGTTTIVLQTANCGDLLDIPPKDEHIYTCHDCGVLHNNDFDNIVKQFGFSDKSRRYFENIRM